MVLAMFMTITPWSNPGARQSAHQETLPPVDERVRALVEALEDPNARVRYSALEAMAVMGPDARAAVPALAEALGDPDAGVRGAAAGALRAIGSEAKPAVPGGETFRAWRPLILAYWLLITK